MKFFDKNRLLTIAFLTITCSILFMARPAEAANRYWVGGSGTWNDDDNHWAKSSGGAPGNGNRPGSNDRALFDGNSGGGTCTLDRNVNVKGFELRAGNTTTISQGSRTVTVGTKDFTVTSGTFQGGTNKVTCKDKLTINGGTFNAPSNTLRIKGDFSMSSGTFLGSSAEINLDKKFTLSGGDFTSTSGTMKVPKNFTISGGTFTHNSGTVEFDNGNLTITPSTTNFNDVKFNKGNKTFTVAGGQALNVTGETILKNGKINGNVNAKGDITIDGTSWDGGNGTITANGTGTQTFTGGGSTSKGKFVDFVINKASGTLNLASIIRTDGDWTYTQGTVAAGTSEVVFAGTLVVSSGAMEFNDVTFDKNKTRTITGTMTVNGTVTFTNGTENGGTISAKGDVDIGSSADGGNATLSLEGSGTQTITGTNNGDFLDDTEINKASGTAVITGTCNPIYNLTVVQGRLDFTGGFTYSFRRGFTLAAQSGTTLNLAGSAGSLVTLRRDGGSGNRWNVNVASDAAYTASYVDVSRSDASPGRLIYACNSTDSGNNVDWYFIDNIVFTTAAQTLDANEVSNVMTIQLQDTSGNPQALGEDYTINLSTTSGGGQFSLTSSPFNLITSVTIASGADSASFYYRDSTAGTPTITAAEEPELCWLDGTQQETITSTTAYFSVSASSPQIAGEAFTVTVTARQADGSIDTGYSGTTNLTADYVTPTSGAMALSPASTSSFVNGVAAVTATYGDCGTITITATDSSDASVNGTSSNVLFNPFDFLVLPSGLTGSAQHVVNQPFTLTVTARNSQAVTCPNYQGPSTLSVDYISPSTPQSGKLSATVLTTGNWVSGVAALASFTYDKYGKITITCADSNNTARTGTSDKISFFPKDFSLVLSDPPASRDFYYTNEGFDLTVTARDFNDATVANYQGTVSFSDTNLNLPGDYTFTIADLGSHLFSGINSAVAIDNAQISVTDTAAQTVTGTSDPLDVEEGSIQVLSNRGPVGPMSLTVRIVDNDGAIITADNATTFLITLTETNDDDSASSATTAASKIITGGAAAIVVTDNQAEAVTVTPSSDPALTAVSGTATYGTVAASGVGIQLWRDLRNKTDDEKE